MQEEELDELAGHKDPLVRKFASHYRDAFYDNRVKKLHIKQLEVADLLIEDMGNLKYLKKSINTDPEKEEEQKEAVSMNLFGNKEIFGQAMDMFKNMGVILASIKAGEIASEIVHPVEEKKAVTSRLKRPPGISTAK